jgi:S1-C subfamily serine protease
VDGRSGGGLFNEQGELIGVCNAAAVEVDEGIYTALETIHWQIAAVDLEHLFGIEGQIGIGNLDAGVDARLPAWQRNQQRRRWQRDEFSRIERPDGTGGATRWRMFHAIARSDSESSPNAGRVGTRARTE